MPDLILYPLKFDYAGAQAEIYDAINVCLDELSTDFQEIIRREILANGNGSGVMKREAIKHVKEISRSITSASVELEVGVDESGFGSDQAKIRTLVVLYGNGEIWTKPGQATWKKHVVGPGPNKVQSSYRLPDLEQTDVSGELLKNAMKEVRKKVKDFIDAVKMAIETIDFSAYLS